jgi:hypothetical protein
MNELSDFKKLLESRGVIVRGHSQLKDESSGALCYSIRGSYRGKTVRYLANTDTGELHPMSRSEKRGCKLMGKVLNEVRRKHVV